MANVEAKQIQKTVSTLIKNVPTRNKDIISRRFGLQNGRKETLESIGKSYGITRERVRQIEEFTLGQLSKVVGDAKEVQKYVSFASNLLNKEGGIMKERDLFQAFSGNDKDTVANSSLVFILTLVKEPVRIADNDRFNAFWAGTKEQLDAFKLSVSTLISSFEKNKTVVPQAKLFEFAQQNGVTAPSGSLTEKYISTILTVSKDINKNIFGEIGLATWNEVRPKGVRDKAYLIMKKQGNAKHFNDIAKLINSAKFGDNKKVNVQTVHNELIKDDRFVLVGRGMYALAEWGYKSGTVKDVLTDILKTSTRPLPKTELVAKVKDVRMVKENTILLNLQDSSHFIKNSDGTYALRKA